MNNDDKMLQLVLSDNNLRSFYEYDPSDYLTVEDALSADNPVIVAVAKIINGLNGNSEKSIQRQVYNEVFNYLNQNML